MPFYPVKKFCLSFELFPPKTPAGEESLWEHVAQLVKYQPDVITCTYGAGGSTRDKTLGIVTEAKKRFGVKVASHLTCVGNSVDQLRDYLREAQARGCDNIVALRGDPPQGQTEFKPVAGGFSYANELVQLIRKEFPQFGIAVAGYPETHQEAPSFQIDLENLKRKASDADVVITQLFYNNRDFFRFRTRCILMGIDKPIIPGLLPVTNLSQIQRITSLCKACLPPEFVAKLAEKDDPEWQFEVGVQQAIQQTQELLDAGVPGIHFYVLNKSTATTRVLEAVNLR